MGRGVLPAGHPLLVTRARGAAFGRPTWSSWSARRWTSGSATARSAASRAPRRRSCTSPTRPAQLAAHVAAGRVGRRRPGRCASRRSLRPRPHRALHHGVGVAAELRGRPSDAAAAARRGACSPATPTRSTRPGLRRAARRAGRRRRGIGDGGDFVSFAGQVRRAGPPGQLARPGPVRLPGHRPRLRHRGPARPPVGAGRAAARRRRGRVLADGRGHAGPARPAGGDGRRQQRRLGLEKHPMRCSTATTSPPTCGPADPLRRGRARRSAAAGERSRGPATSARRCDRAFDSGVPYLVNVLTDPEVAYPRSSVLA